MKLLSFGLLLCVGSALATPQEWVTVRDDLDGEITHYFEEVETPAWVVEAIEREIPLIPRPTIPTVPGTTPPSPIIPPGGRVDIDQIINTAMKIWKIVTDNKPVLVSGHTYANALPKGIKTSEELDNFSSAQYRSYRMSGTNFFGNSVYDVTYTTVHRFGGTYDGRGRYLDTVTVVPRKIDVSWGYTVNFGVDRVAASNVGSKDAPVGSLLMEMIFRVSTAMKLTERRALFEFRGDSAEVAALQ